MRQLGICFSILSFTFVLTHRLFLSNAWFSPARCSSYSCCACLWFFAFQLYTDFVCVFADNINQLRLVQICAAAAAQKCPNGTVEGAFLFLGKPLLRSIAY